MLTLLVVGEESGELQTAYEAIGGFCGFEFLSDERVEAFVKKYGGDDFPGFWAQGSAYGDEDRGPRLGGGRHHDTRGVGHGLEADLAMEGLSCYKGMLGQGDSRSRSIGVVDDKTLPFRAAPMPSTTRDAVAKDRARRKRRAEELPVRPFHAMKYERRPPANGRRESSGIEPIPRMSNTLILPGADRPGRA